MVHDRFPDKKLILSEACIEYSKFASDDYLKNAQKYAHDIKVYVRLEDKMAQVLVKANSIVTAEL